MKTNFFRKDLNLKKRWWHRLFFVLFILIIIGSIGYEAVNFINYYKTLQWEKVDTLLNRIKAEANTIGRLLKPGEKVAEID
ncbi:hypothetical protein GF366_02085, partial [Candidatus Peregrinibacteria bacterium]|nr:hypothetical protein [Candidatus Peregrinibacteria bacterium]